MQTLIRLLLQEQSGQGPYGLLYRLSKYIKQILLERSRSVVECWTLDWEASPVSLHFVLEQDILILA